MGKTVNEQIAKGRMLVEGLRNNLDELASKGVNAEMVEKLEKLCNQTEEKGGEQDKLNEEYHRKTAEVSSLMAALKGSINEIKSVIKPHYLPTEWAKYGIPDKK